MAQRPPAEDELERLLDELPVRYTVNLDPALHERLLAEQERREKKLRRMYGRRVKVTLRSIIVEALELHLPPGSAN